MENTVIIKGAKFSLDGLVDALYGECELKKRYAKAILLNTVLKNRDSIEYKGKKIRRGDIEWI
jgi:hypothetical protein